MPSTFVAEAVSLFVGGVGLMADGYDFSVINLVRSDLADLYPPSGERFATSWQRSLITASSIFGAMAGQLVLGFLADRLGRRRLLLVSGSLTIAGAIGSASAFDFGEGHIGIWTLLIFWRFVMGFGLGGEYPLSAAHTAEHSHAKQSGRKLAAVFVLFGFGPLLASIVVYACQISGASAEFTWRFAFGFGAALSVLSLCVRYRLVRNSASFERVRMARERRTQRQAMLGGEAGIGVATQEMAVAAGGDGPLNSARAALRETLGIASRFRRPLLGTTLCWLLYDIVDYGLGLYSDDVLQHLKVGSGHASTTLAVMIVQMLSLPGCLASVWLVTRLGRRGTQLVGLLGMLLTYTALAIILTLPSLTDVADKQPALMVSLYALQLIFDYMGPGATTYIIPAELFPTAARATCHGLSAASGKVGAAIGSYAFGNMIDQLGLRGCFVFTACMSALLILVTFTFIPDYDGVTLGYLEAADHDGEAMLLLYRPEEYHARRRLEGDGRMEAGGDAVCRSELGSPASSVHLLGCTRALPPSPPASPPAAAASSSWRVILHAISKETSMPNYRELARSDDDDSNDPLVVVTFDTDGFRRLARLQVDLHTDSIVEIGCSYGGCSQLLIPQAADGGCDHTTSRPIDASSPSSSSASASASAASSSAAAAASSSSASSSSSSSSAAAAAAAPATGRFLGLDNSFECVSHCRKLLPTGRFERVDALADHAGLLAVLESERPTIVVVDVGGNRGLADVTELIERVVAGVTRSPEVATKPGVPALLILVKSESLVEELRKSLPEQGASFQTDQGQQTMIRCPHGWWAHMRARCMAEGDKAAGIDRHRLRPPTWYPQRAGPDGRLMCRFHNYDVTQGCKRGDRCSLDHVHCHYCMRAGHAAHACTEFRATFEPQPGSDSAVAQHQDAGLSRAMPPSMNCHLDPVKKATWHSKSAALNDKLDAMIARSREKRKEENIKE